MGRPTQERTDDRTLDRSRPEDGVVPRGRGGAVNRDSQVEAGSDREQRAASEGDPLEREPHIRGAARASFAAEDLILLPHRCLYWPREQTLFLADAHFGKTATFRDAGIPIPAGTTRADLDRLADAIECAGAQRVVILGDLLHHKRGMDDRTLEEFARWRADRRSRPITLVRGNHDRSAGDPPESWGIECVSGPVTLGPFRLVHEPDETPPEETHTLAGHIHPCVRLHGKGRQSLRAPCFHFANNLALLPAFGSFTGMHRVSPRAGDCVYAVGDGRVLSLNSG